MRVVRPAYVFATALALLALPDAASAEGERGMHKLVVSAEVPLAIPLSTPLRDRFGLGTMPSVSASLPIGDWLLAGLRLRCGFLSNGPAPSDPAVKDPGMGGLAALSAVGRFRPLAKSSKPSRLSGPWIEVGVGAGLTGDLVRALGEVAAGWGFGVGRWKLGPSVRYLHVVQPKSELDGADAQILLVGIEIGLHDAHAAAAPAEAAPVLPAAPEKKNVDSDGDGIPDDVDACPNEPEDKDGFEDEDGCPDPDNDKDGIPDKTDACPNEPETVNGFKDEDGCPDDAPIVVKQDRILLTEHVLFDTNRARVRTEGRPALAAVLNLWKQHPEWDYLVVDGYADQRGPDGYNLWLSHVRAERVRKVLIEMGFPGDKLRLRAFGHRQVRVQGTDEESYRQNRRAEFVIVKKGEAGPAGTEVPTTTQETPPPLTPPPAQGAEPPPAQGVEPPPAQGAEP